MKAGYKECTERSNKGRRETGQTDQTGEQTPEEPCSQTYQDLPVKLTVPSHKFSISGQLFQANCFSARIAGAGSEPVRATSRSAPESCLLFSDTDPGQVSCVNSRAIPVPAPEESQFIALLTCSEERGPCCHLLRPECLLHGPLSWW